MIRSELITAAFSDTHRENYALTTVLPNRFLQQAESLIASKLESYGLEYTFTDADRAVAAQPVYTSPARVTLVRHIGYNGCHLDQVDESFVSMRSSSNVVECFAVRPRSLVFAGNPPALATMLMQYMGIPAPLVLDADTNALLSDYPQLYIEAMSIYIHKRAQDYDSGTVASQSFNSLVDEINRKVKKQLGGARPVNGYNTAFRSSY